MRQTICLIISLFLIRCGASPKESSIEMISSPDEQISMFTSLLKVTGEAIPEGLQDDSLAILILPLQASCPACRNKTIDSISEHASSLVKNHYVVISVNGSRKTINGYFQENDRTMPAWGDCLILDSNNIAYKYKLYDKKPTFYYTSKRKVFKKVSAVPSTVRDDLKEFFSGLRN